MSHFLRRCSSAAALVTGATLLGSCLQELPATEILLNIESNLTVPEQLQKVHVVLQDPTNDLSELGAREYAVKPAPAGGQYGMAPLAVWIAADGSSDRKFLATITGLRERAGSAAPEVVVTHQATLRFVARATVPYDIYLSQACFEKQCPAGLTCTAGECEDIPEPPPSAPGDAAVVGGTDARMASEAAVAEAPDSSLAGAPPPADAASGPHGAAADGGAEPVQLRDGGPPVCRGAACAEAGAVADAAAKDAGAPPRPAADAGARDGGAQPDGGSRTCVSESECKSSEYCDFTQMLPVCRATPACPGSCSTLKSRCVMVWPASCTAKTAPCADSPTPECRPKIGMACGTEAICELGTSCCNGCSCAPNGALCTQQSPCAW
jgi:hypothetical protein